MVRNPKQSFRTEIDESPKTHHDHPILGPREASALFSMNILQRSREHAVKVSQQTSLILTRVLRCKIYKQINKITVRPLV